MRSFYTVDELQKAVLATGIAVLFFLFTNGQKGLEFNSHVVHSGVPGENHCVYRFISVSKGVDALVKIKKRSAENIVLENIDVNYTGFTHAFQPRIGPAGGSVNGKSEWWMDFEIRFVKSGTLSTAHVKTFHATVLDIDGDGGSIAEYIEMFKAESYVIEKPSLLTVYNLPEPGSGPEEADDDDDKGRGRRFVADCKNFEGIDTLATEVMATMQFKHVNKITLRIGASKSQNGNSTAAYRYNSIWFKSFEYETAAFLPVTLSSFAVTYKNEQALLQWSTLAETNFSHFVIEKSINGVEFSDAAVLFTEDNTASAKNYVYTDPVINAPIIYYRLRMVDLDGKFNLSSVRLIRTHVLGKEAMEVFPNPVTKELRITIPANWQGSRVVYQISGQDGRVVRRWSVYNASQTEVTDFSTLPTGTYFILVQKDATLLTQKIIRK